MSRPIDAVHVLNDINWHHKPTPVSEFESGFNQGLNTAMRIITQAPTLTPPNELMEALEAINNAAVAYMEGGPYENDLPGLEFALEIDRLSRDFVRPPNEWVSVEERKKPKRGELIVYADSTAWGFRYGVCRVHGAETNFTHWMPLPEPPDSRPPEGEEDT